MDKTYTKGELLQIETINGEVFEGSFYSQNSDKTKISLHKARELPKGERIEGVTHYYKSEIQEIIKVNSEDVAKSFNKLLRLSQEECEDMMKISKRYIYINQVDNTFHEALDDLRHYNYIAIGTECADMGRKAKLPILTMSTPIQIYIFDIQVMQYHAFDGGLKQLLENECPRKIVHNCRKLSDCLYHKHNIQLNSVFDTQVGDIIITKNKTGRLPVNVRTLEECLTTYLGLPPGLLHVKIDIVACSKRPLNVEIKEVAAKNITYLHRLSEVIHEEMLMPFTRGVQCYIEGIRSSDDFEAWQSSGRDNQLPKDFKKAIEFN